MFSSRNMEIGFTITLFCVLFSSDLILAEGDNEIKRGVFKFMAFLYYPDIEDVSNKMIQGASLIKPNWLISSVNPIIAVDDVADRFPRKTLIARLGAVTIDGNFSLNEDEDEQEREVIQIVHPYSQNSAQWWRTDVSLLKTLLPFNFTKSVGPSMPQLEVVSNYTNCFVLLFSKQGNITEDRALMQIAVDVLPSSDECGKYYHEETMLCANDAEESFKPSNEKYCYGNSGGPLICENDIVGVQIYVENKCKPPHLYQRLSAWKSFISCAIEDKCETTTCTNTCRITNKDEVPKIESAPEAITTDKSSRAIPDEEIQTKINIITEESTMASSTIDSSLSTDDTEPSPTLTTATVEHVFVEKATSTLPKTYTQPAKGQPVNDETSWPKEKYPPRNNAPEEEAVERKPNVEAQRHVKALKAKSGAVRNKCFLHSVLSIFILACLI